ncbi:Putative ATP:guanido phosphotransferase [Limihaloglobus sulfuriphilus]|uniref:Putative ATP:guanido phosphotransferase n=1 Tax=Limihaloglobus sulfuriphilus TaxID=1851148 RepID=A0A1Q2MBY1_9BACT|nr:ATP--guanido phosphotransferase [Limihaloglobus sulfuriphilus]AQQ70169.1 Putative ATP:guanido phosphotransferase [Limihaloglobus sulfuriphilus]
MQLNELSTGPCGWFDQTDQNSGIVISSRVRLARNIKGYNFSSTLSSESSLELLNQLYCVIDEKTNHNLSFFRIDNMTELEVNFLVERNLITSVMAFSSMPRGVFLSDNELTSIMVNEEDHLRLQAFSPGFNLNACWKRIDRLDDLIESSVKYAFDSRLGYLTACPTNVGTGLRISVMLHLAGLKMTGELEKVKKSASAMKLALRGLWGEGSGAMGDMYQVSNELTLGISEQDCLNDFTENIIPQIVKYEMIAREELLRRPAILDDKIFRALAILKNARMISSAEAMSHLCRLRLGILLGRVTEVSLERVNGLFFFILPSHLQMSLGKQLTREERDYLRANLIRDILRGGE